MLKIKPRLYAKYDKHGKCLAAFPRLLGHIFPNTLHVRVLGEYGRRIGCIGQPEMFFPVRPEAVRVPLNCFSPTASPLLKGRVREVPRWSFKSMAIAMQRRHKKLSRRAALYLDSGGQVFFSDALERKEFADIYIRLHCERWGFNPGDFRYLREQILQLYEGVFGVVLFEKAEPVAAQLCFRATGKSMYYVDFINSGVKIQRDNQLSFGSIMILMGLRKSEEIALSLGKTLRYSFGYYYGERNYKSIWAQPEPTFIGI